MLGRIRDVGYAIWWWGVRRWNGLRDLLGRTDLPDLKEFVYIDEDALISLLASTTGGITQQRTTTKRKQISSSITSSLGPLGSSVGSQEEKASEAVRKYVVQSNFKEFYDMWSDEVTLTNSPSSPPKPVAAAADQDEFNSFVPELEAARKSKLGRGDLVELRATLGSAQIYDYLQVMDAFEEMIESFSTEEELRHQLRLQNISSEKVAMVVDLMDILMAGLIPVECTLSNYGVATENPDVIVDKEWAEKQGIAYSECSAVGYIDEDNLWQDPTQVLFEKEEFEIYARLEDPVPSQEWNPLKLVDVVHSILPELGDELSTLQEGFDSPKPIAATQDPDEFEDELTQYLEWVTESNGLQISSQSKENVVESLDSYTLPITLGEKKEVFQDAESKLADELEAEVDVSSEERANHLGGIWSPESDEVKVDGAKSDAEFYLATNFIAIYW